jgi:hypothetical protein
MLPGLVGQGGYDYNAIQVILDSFGVEKDHRPNIVRKVVSLIDVIEKERKAREK